MHTKLETAEQRDARLWLMYGKGASDGEWDQAEYDSVQAKIELDRSKARVANADAEETLANDCDDCGDCEDCKLEELDEGYGPRDPITGRLLNSHERTVLWLRMCRLAGGPLDPFPQPSRRRRPL